MISSDTIQTSLAKVEVRISVSSTWRDIDGLVSRAVKHLIRHFGRVLEQSLRSVILTVSIRVMSKFALPRTNTRNAVNDAHICLHVVHFGESAALEAITCLLCVLFKLFVRITRQILNPLLLNFLFEFFLGRRSNHPTARTVVLLATEEHD